MDDNNWMAAQAPGSDATAPAPVAADGAVGTGDWHAQLPRESRHRIVNKIMDTLKRHITLSGSDGRQELRNLANKFEEKIYAVATDQSDYLRRISMKMLSMESKSETPVANSMQQSSTQNSQLPGTQAPIQNQVNSQGQPLSIPMVTSQSQTRQQLMSHNIQNNNITSNGLQNAANQGAGLQVITNVSQNSAGNTMGQGMCSNMATNSQRQVQGRQQHEQQQSQTSSQFFYPQHVHSQMMKHQSLVQSHIQQQQNLIQHNQIQSSQQSSVQQPTQAVPQQHSQSVLRQQQNNQQQGSLMQQSMLQTQQQQQLTGNQQNVANIQQNQMIGQQNSLLDMHQQHQQHRMMPQQSNYSNIQHQKLLGQQNIHQQQIAGQGNVVGLQQQQMHGNHSCSSGMQTNQHPIQITQRSKVPVQEQMFSNSTTQGLPSQPQQTQQQLMSQSQAQPGALQMQHQANSLQREMQQRIQASSPMLQQQNVIDQQKQLLQQQRATPEAPSTSLDSTAQTGNENGTDWQEEIYQKIKSLRDTYFLDLKDAYIKACAKLAQLDYLPQGAANDQFHKLKNFKLLIERIVHTLCLKKNEIQLHHKEIIGSFEKQVRQFVNTNKPRKPGSSMQQGQGQPPQLQMQPQHTQIHDNQINPQKHQVNLQSSMAAMQHNNMQQNPLSSVSTVSGSQQNMINMLQHSTSMDLGQGSSLSSLQMVATSSLQQNTVTCRQHMNTSAISSRSGANTLQPNLSITLNPNSNMIQQQYSKQHEQQMLHNQQMRHQNQQQLYHKQQLMQQQRHMKQSQAHQIQKMSDCNDMKMRQHMGVKSVVVQQRVAAHHPHHKSSISSPQFQQASSPQIPSPQIDQQNVLASLTKAGTPLQSSSSPFVVPSPSTPMAPSPMPGESEKVSAGMPSLPNAGNVVHQQATSASAPSQSLAIGTPGISASPLLAEFTSPDGTHANVSTISEKSIVEQPLERLIKVANRMSPEAFSLSVSDMSSVVSMIDRRAGSAPGNGSRAAVGEDLVGMTRWHMQAKKLFAQDGCTGTKKMKRYTSSNVVSSSGSVYDSFTQRNGSETSDLESTATSTVKKPRIELQVNHSLAQEIKDINRRLIDTVVEISDEGVDPSIQAAAGITVKCSFSAVGVSPNLKSHFSSVQMSPIQPLRMLVPCNYPESSPILLDTFPVETSKGSEDISIKTKSRFCTSLRGLSQPMSLNEIASTWDVCARAVISEYAQQNGGGSFSTKYGTWENCLSSS